jgi:hypothetical protein
VGNILFIPDGWSSNGTVNGFTLTDGSALVGNLIDINPARGVLSNIPFEVMTILLEGPSDTIDSFCVLYTTTLANHTWRVEAALVLDDIGTANLIDSGFMPFWPHAGLGVFQYRHAFWRAPTPQICSAVRITISGLPQFYVGHVKVGLGFQPEVNFSFSDGFGFGWTDPAVINRPPAGPPQITAYPRRQSMRINMNFQTLVDALTFVELSYQYGGSHPIFVVLDPDNTVWTHYIMMNALIEWADPPVMSAPGVDRFQVPLTLREYGP